MQQPTLTLQIRPDKYEAFLALVALLDFVEVVENTPPSPQDFVPPAPPLYNTEKTAFTVEDLHAIAAHFPKNYAWTYTALQTYFPQDLLLSVQIIQNQLFIMASPNFHHQEISIELASAMRMYAKQHQLGKVVTAPSDVVFDENNVVQPDIIFLAVSKYHQITSQGIQGSPDLVVEIWSPANKKKERNLKHELYAANGVTEYWQIFPKKKKVRVEVLNEAQEYVLFSSAKETGVVQSKVLEGFEVEVSSLFGE
jgi:Uma2 family endonuclease